MPTNKRTSHVKGKSLNYERVIYKYTCPTRSRGVWYHFKNSSLRYCHGAVAASRFLFKDIKWALRKDTRLKAQWSQICCREIQSAIKYRKLYWFSFNGNKLSIFSHHRYEITPSNKITTINSVEFKHKWNSVKQWSYNAAGWRIGGGWTRWILRICMQSQCFYFH